MTMELTGRIDRADMATGRMATFSGYRLQVKYSETFLRRNLLWFKTSALDLLEVILQNAEAW